EEFVPKWGAANALQTFQAGDRDHNGMLSFEEYCHPDWSGYEDPVEAFRKADKDYDGLVDLNELEAATRTFQKVLVPMTLPAFDSDGDQKLSLQEYRLSMLGNRLCPWESIPTDTDRSGTLSFEE